MSWIQLVMITVSYGQEIDNQSYVLMQHLFVISEKALDIYKELPTNYRRAMAEIHYKIGLSYLMQQSNKEGAESLKEACKLIAGEIDEMKAKTGLTEKDKNNIQDMEETKQEIEAKIVEIEETQAQVRYIPEFR